MATDPHQRPSGGQHGAHSATARRPRRRRWLSVAGILAVAIVALAGVVILRRVEHHPATPSAPSTSMAPSTPPLPHTATPPAAPSAAASAELTSSFATLEQSTSGVVGVAVTPLGGGPVMTFGQWSTGPAWSTSKVPLVMAALRDEAEPTVTSSMEGAIVRSDNDAAEAIWEGLGDPATAAGKVEAVLRDAGDDTTVESQRKRAEYTAFGQTIWSLTDQAGFLSRAACDARMEPVLDLMGKVEAGQRWGLGAITDAQFKGGWGPSPDGRYLVRQFGLVPTGQGTAVVAIAAEPASGSFGAGTADLDSVASWLATNLAQLPAGRCAAQ